MSLLGMLNRRPCLYRLDNVAQMRRALLRKQQQGQVLHNSGLQGMLCTLTAYLFP
jgi:hypothetical protein